MLQFIFLEIFPPPFSATKKAARAGCLFVFTAVRCGRLHFPTSLPQKQNFSRFFPYFAPENSVRFFKNTVHFSKNSESF